MVALKTSHRLRRNRRRRVLPVARGSREIGNCALARYARRAASPIRPRLRKTIGVLIGMNEDVAASEGRYGLQTRKTGGCVHSNDHRGAEAREAELSLTGFRLTPQLCQTLFSMILTVSSDFDGERSDKIL
jgi:hypothetical protein